MGYAGGVVCDGRSGDDGDDFEEMILAESGGKKGLCVGVRDAAAGFDEGACESREGGEFWVGGQLTASDGLDVSVGNALLQGEVGMKSDGPLGGIGDGVGEEHDLDLRLGEGAMVDVLKEGGEAVGEDW